MMIKKYRYQKIIAYSMFICVIASAFRFKTDEVNINNSVITLKWYKSYPSENWQQVRTGLLWSFSQMGAMLPKGSFDSAVSFKDSTTFSVELTKLGFSNKALEALIVICDSIKHTEQYQSIQSIDLSRFVVLTLHSPNHYYKITGAESLYNNFINRYHLTNPNVFGVTKSVVSKQNRLIKVSKDSVLFNIGFVAEEGTGSLVANSFIPEEFEAIDVMPNGQLRYAIYNKKGRLIEASSAKFSGAGKPSKCMWCHESIISPLYTNNIAVENMLTNNQFLELRNMIQQKLDSYRKTLSGDIDFEKKQDHTQSELLYIGFMEPSIYRLKQEFNNDSMILKTIEKQITHLYNEFTFLGNLYHRKKTDSYLQQKAANVPYFVREKSNFEANYFKKKK